MINLRKLKKKIEEAEDVLKFISSKPEKGLIVREVRLDLLRAAMNKGLGNFEIAEKYSKKILESQKELGNRFEFARANQIMAEIMMWGKSRFDLAMEYGKKVLSIAKAIKFNHIWIAVGNAVAAIAYHYIGELENSLKHYMKVIKIMRKFKSDLYVAMTLNNIGNLHAELGDYEMALQYLEESLKLWEQDPLQIEDCFDSIIAVALKKGDFVLAQKYFQHLENMYNQTPDTRIEILYKYNKALLLKNSSRIRNKAKAEKIFKNILKTESTIPDIKINSYIHLCDLLFAEYRMNKNGEVLEEINQNITQLLTIAEKSHSYIVFCEAFILQAKLALLTFNIKAARRFLTQAQKIAESFGLKRLAMKISYEHDKLLKQTHIWENLNHSEVSLSERIELAGLEEQMEDMVKKRITEFPDVKNEEPVLLLIVSEGGIPYYSHSFLEDKTFESHLFGGFLSTIDYFIKEVFSEGLDRAVFGRYTLLMKSISPFFISYVFKGDSYYSLKKLERFKDRLLKEEEIWKRLLDNFEKSIHIQIEDDPLFNALINETFISNNFETD